MFIVHEVRNGLSGKIPDEVRILSHISMLWLNENTIGGSLPTQLGRLTDLAFFDISDNTIDGTIPSEIGNMQNLQELNVRKNTLSGAVPAEVSSLSSLSNFWADGNFLTGDVINCRLSFCPLTATKQPVLAVSFVATSVTFAAARVETYICKFRLILLGVCFHSFA